MKKNLKNEKGIALVAVLLMITVISILSVALMGVTATNIKLSSGERDYQSVYYIAEAGAIKAYQNIKNERLMDIYEEADSAEQFFGKLQNELGPIIINNFEESFGHEPYAEVNLNGHPEEYHITSTGFLGNRSRTVTLDINIDWVDKPSGFYFAIYANDIELGGNAKIIGDVAMLSPQGSFTRGNATHDDSVVDINDIPDREKPPPFPLEFLPDFKDASPLPRGTVKADGYYEEIKGNTTIDVSNGDRMIRVKRLQLGNGDEIKLIGDGRLILYVEDNLSLHNGGKINSGGVSDKMTIFYPGSNLTLRGEIIGSLYAPYAAVTSNGGLLEGSIIADRYTAQGNAATFEPPNFTSMPGGRPSTGEVTAEDLIEIDSPVKEQ
ncbi:PilX N-terminal domain-containing pilus assembly protein [Evansella sp. LMS18]|uniref:DUF7305 domain-containing protein n=1 Tax=Evansella sp. LMS18 TaxID=2924033 RepID=UPI0020D1DCB8|nr:PilX N-terminal domain-containing pilus assembly protein [Evansella sp. LMS18]UTR11250.1 PilX N-terminal domain-containing pilus assembly protein [Evansella sp. LMS18]